MSHKPTRAEVERWLETSAHNGPASVHELAVALLAAWDALEADKIRLVISAAWPGPECGSAYNGIVVSELARAVSEHLAAALPRAEGESV